MEREKRRRERAAQESDEIPSVDEDDEANERYLKEHLDKLELDSSAAGSDFDMDDAF